MSIFLVLMGISFPNIKLAGFLAGIFQLTECHNNVIFQPVECNIARAFFNLQNAPMPAFFKLQNATTLAFSTFRIPQS
jgi:hypothetical protein